MRDDYLKTMTPHLPQRSWTSTKSFWREPTGRQADRGEEQSVILADARHIHLRRQQHGRQGRQDVRLLGNPPGRWDREELHRDISKIILINIFRSGKETNR